MYRLLKFVVGLVCAIASAQTTGATFGDVIKLGGTPSDVVLDESRSRLYLVNSSANRVDVYNYASKTLMGSIPVGVLPYAAAMSMDSAFLYVTNNGSSSLTAIDLNSGIGAPIAAISLPAKPEGVEVGNDGRVLISTQGTGTATAPANVLLIYDRTQASASQIQSVTFPPPPTTPVTLPALTTKPTTTFHGKLLRNPNGSLIVGVNNISANANTLVYVYEVSSGTVLRSRASVGQSTSLAMSPDGSRFMAGFTMFDIATLAVIGQMSNTNAPFAFTTAFNTTTNLGGAVFSPDGSTLYAAYNIAANTTPAPAPNASTLLVSDPTNLAIKLGIKVPESIVAKLVQTADGSQAWASSQSGLVHLPLAQMYNYPILMPDQTAVFLAQDDCNPGVATATVKINNIGAGRMTVAIPSVGNALSASVNTGLAPATLTLQMDPGVITANNRQAGTNLYTGNNGLPVLVNVSSPQAINVPSTILVYMNYRQPDQRGQVFPIPTAPNSAGTTAGQGLKDIVVDEQRNLVYISNAGMNRIEVFDRVNQQFINPLPAGQFPSQMALGSDGNTLYVASSGGESISIIDLDSGTIAGNIGFPPIPRAVTTTTAYSVAAMADGLSGLQMIMSTGTQWHVVGNTALPRSPSSIINSAANNTSTTVQSTLTSPVTMAASPDYSSIVVLAGGGLTYLYDALADAFTASSQLFPTPLQGYFGPLAAAPSGAYYLVNGLIVNGALSVLGGATSPSAGATGSGVSVVSTAGRNIAGVAPVNASQFVRLSTPVKTNVTSATTDDPRTTLTLVDMNAGSENLVAVVPENPIVSLFGTTKTAVPARQMAVDSLGNAYILTISGLSVVPMASGSNNTPTLNNQQPFVNATDGSQSFQPGSFITVNGQSLASTAVPLGLTAPTRLGGSCVLFNDVAIPLLSSSPTQLSAQIPPTLRPGLYVAQVRSLSAAQRSAPVVVQVSAPTQ